MKTRCVVAEIIGPSGAGKSTLSGLLKVRNPTIKTGLTIWGLPRFLLVKSILISLPKLARLRIEDKDFNSEQGKQIVRLQAFYEFIKGQDNTAGSYFFDEGAVFAISKLHADQQKFSLLMEQWEEEILDRWAQMFNTIVWLDASDEVLIERIRRRSKSHRMKAKSDSEVIEFLKRYREAYENVVRKLSERDRINILKFDTENRDIEDIADEISSIIRNMKVSSPDAVRQIEVDYEDVYQ